MVYAFAICKLYDLSLISHVSFLLSKRAERYGERNLGQVLLQQISDKKKLALYCASVPVDIKLLNQLYNQVRFEQIFLRGSMDFNLQRKTRRMVQIVQLREI